MIRPTAAPLAAAALVGALALGGCHGERKAKADTGTAEVTVKTKAPESAVSSSDLQQQAQTAADAASTPVANTSAMSATTTTTTTSNTAH